MTGRLVDTSVFIDYLRADRRAYTFLAECRRDGPVRMHGVVAAELVTGVGSKSELRHCRALVSTCELVVPDESDVRRSIGLLERHALASGAGWHDCLIAATALRFECEVATLNEKHFCVFKGLKVVRPY